MALDLMLVAVGLVAITAGFLLLSRRDAVPLLEPVLIDRPYVAPRPAPSARSAAGWLAGAGFLAWKFGTKALLALKFLKFGKFFLTGGTMVLSMALYAIGMGWPFAVGFVLAIFVHEMGHALVIWRKGLRAGAPVFIPFVGALISLKDQPRDVRVEAEIAMGGPAAGAAAALIFWAFHLLTGSPLLGALAHVAFFLNLFNLLPMSPLDGGRIVGAISPWLWVIGLGVVVLALFVSPSPILFLLLLMGGGRAWSVWRSRGLGGEYFRIPLFERVVIGGAYFGLSAFLALMWMLSAPTPA